MIQSYCDIFEVILNDFEPQNSHACTVLKETPLKLSFETQNFKLIQMTQTQRQSEVIELYIPPLEQFFKWRSLRLRICRFKNTTQVWFLAYFEP